MTPRSITSTALPLLQGIAGRPQAATIAQEALEQYHAKRTIERVLRQWIQQRHRQHREAAAAVKPRRKKRRRKTASSSRKRQKSTDGAATLISSKSAVRITEHWLTRALGSYVAAERAAAARFSLQSADDNKNLQWKLVSMLQDKFQRLLLLQQDTSTSPPVVVSVEWMSLIYHLLSLSNDNNTTASFQSQPQLSLALFGLVIKNNWFHHFWKLSISSQHSQKKMMMIISVLVDCFQRLLHKVLESGDATVDAQRLQVLQSCNQWLWTTQNHNNNNNSQVLLPLACLMGGYFVLRHPSEPIWSSRSQQTAISTLEKLIDPATPVQLESASDRNSSTAQQEQQEHPLDSLVEEQQHEEEDDDVDEDDEEVFHNNNNKETSQEENNNNNNTVLEEMQNHRGTNQNEEAGDNHVAENEDEEIDSLEGDDDDEVGEGEDDEEEEDHEEICAEDDDTVVREGDTVPLDAAGILEMNDDEEDDEDDDDDEPMEMEIEDLAAMAAEPPPPPTIAPGKSSPLSPSLEDRRHMYITAAIQIMALQYPHSHHHQHSGSTRQSYLTIAAESALLESINKIVRPPKKPLNTKIIMRRAPTQEEFFRGSLTRNPIPVSILKPPVGNHVPDSYDPTVADLRQHIANDLQMSDSAELIEIIVANKILDVNLKLRVVHQVLWRNHLMENASSSSSGPTLFASGSSLSVFFSSGLSERVGGRSVTADTPMSALPPMVATYRLAGVDGEATEDTVDVGDLVDPEAPTSASADELEKLMETEYGITRLVTEGRGLYIMLRSIQHSIGDALRQIRRDDVGCTGKNPSRAKFKQDPPCPGLTLLGHCSKLTSNRKKLLQARAPTVLLNLLLDVLKVLEEPQSGESESSRSNPTVEKLQELIEVLTSDIRSTSPTDTDTTVEGEGGYESDAQDAASMPLLLESIETISLSSPLRNVIAKLLPFLTYGQANLSRELAEHFDRFIVVESLGQCENEGKAATKSSILMNTFVQTAISLPPNEVCNSLRQELINCGFIERVTLFIMQGMPKQPPSWSSALWAKGENMGSSQKKKGKETGKRKTLEDGWRDYFQRNGLKTAFKILSGLCKNHAATQARVAMFSGFLRSCHWVEATSDYTAANVYTYGLGLLAETLLDDMVEGNDEVTKLVEGVRKKTKLRKKEIAQERRDKTLLKMGSSFGAMAGTVASQASASEGQSSVRGAAASILAPVFGLFQNPSPANSAAAASNLGGTARAARSTEKGKKSPKKPAWMAEMESMEDETGLTCAVCQEGRTLQPTEVIGLYAYVKKVAIPYDQCGMISSIDGTVLLKALPSSLPASLVGSHTAEEWYPIGKAAGDDLPSSSLSSGGRRTSIFTTTVSAGNGIHFSCHRRARIADRNHPKAPKSEWEGAILRNNRVSCNVILPLVSSRSSKVPLHAVDAALTEHQSAVSNLLGTGPKSMLWTVLHDVRLLLLRMAYGESFSSDCGGGSLASNSQLLFYQLLMADMFDKDAQVDQPQQSQHARCLSAGFLAACTIVSSKDFHSGGSALTRGIADAAPMAGLTCILFHNMQDDFSHKSEGASDDVAPNPKRQWIVGKEHFLRGLLICGGRRHALGLEGSGCQTGRSSRQRSSSFADWDVVDGDNDDTQQDSSSSQDVGRASRGRQSSRRGANKPTIEDFKHALRPMITLFAILDKLSAEFTLSMEDVKIQESSERLVEVIEACQRCRSIQELLSLTNVTMDHDEMMDLLQKGMVAA